MRRTSCWTFFCLLLFSASSPAQNVGVLELSFQGTGFRIEPTPSDDYVAATYVAPDGKILVAGTDISVQPSGMVVRRYLDNGDPDPSFGSNGYVLCNVRPLEGLVVGLGMQSDGKIVIAGGQQSQWHPVVERLLPNGDLDTTFGQSGVVDLPIQQGSQYGLRLFVLANDRILMGYFEGNELGACRLMPDGSADSSYGLNGFSDLQVSGGVYRHNAVAIDADGRLLFGGVRGTNFVNGNFLARLDSIGAIDSSFGGNGHVVIPSGTFDHDFKDVVCHPDGSCFALGYLPNQPFYSVIAIGKYLANGDVDTTFGTSGLKVISAGPTSMEGSKILVDGQGDLVIVGSASSSSYEFMLAKMHPDGTMDTGVGPSGWRSHMLGSGSNICRAAAFDSQGRLVLAGNTFAQDNHCTVARVLMGAPLGLEPDDFVVWPNRATQGYVNIGFVATSAGSLSYRVVDLQGRLVAGSTSPLHLSTGSQAITIPIDQVASGLYLLQVMFDGKTVTRRLLVN